MLESVCHYKGRERPQILVTTITHTHTHTRALALVCLLFDSGESDSGLKRDKEFQSGAEIMRVGIEHADQLFL